LKRILDRVIRWSGDRVIENTEDRRHRAPSRVIAVIGSQ
jgi:hypothetical protein